MATSSQVPWWTGGLSQHTLSPAVPCLPSPPLPFSLLCSLSPPPPLLPFSPPSPPLSPHTLLQELVQVESIAQLGVFLLLFGLGMELNIAKIRSVAGVSIIGRMKVWTREEEVWHAAPHAHTGDNLLTCRSCARPASKLRPIHTLPPSSSPSPSSPLSGGSMQILIAMLLGGAISAWMCDSPIAPGIFVGALLSMSSTSVVVKCLEATRCGYVWGCVGMCGGAPQPRRCAAAHVEG